MRHEKNIGGLILVQPEFLTLPNDKSGTLWIPLFLWPSFRS